MAQDYSLGPCYTGASWGLLRHVLTRRPSGFALEFGVGIGDSLRVIAEKMRVVGFDSFQGLPEDWRPGYPKGSLACAPPIVANSRLVIGLFAETLPRFRFETVEPIGLVHIDCDLYSSAATVLQYVGPHLRPGCFVVFDEWHGYDGCEGHEQRAWREYADRSALTWNVVGCSGQGWAIEISC